MLKEAQKGAQSVGAETEYVDLYDLDFTGCRSCLACKRKDAERNKCYWNDDLSPLIEKILHADAVIIGSPIYLSEPSAHFRALFERLIFCTLSYNDNNGYFDGKVNVGLIYTMNAPRSYYETTLQPVLGTVEALYRKFLRGEVLCAAACNTLQVNDYSLYSMGKFSEEDKKEGRENQFPLDLQEAFRIGSSLSKAD